MKPFAWRWLVASSLLLAALAAAADTRPQYGGTLHITMHAAPMTLDPADPAQADSFARRNLSSLLFDRLVTTDEAGRAAPGLAESWEALKGNQRWLFRLRHGVTFHDGTPLSAEIAAASLRYANPSWAVMAENDTVVIDCKTANPDLLAQLSLSRNSIVKRDSAALDGTGPFSVAEWQPGKKLKVAATENYWGGRPFLDGIEIEMGQDYRAQMTALGIGKADLTEVPPQQARRVSQEGIRLASSAPMQLLALLFAREPSSPEEKTMREVLGLSVERGSIRSVLLQGAGQPAASLLPTWMSGYGFVFSVTANLPKARQLRDQVRGTANWKLGYDASDPIERLVAERIALNARDAGLTLQPTASPNSELRLVRVPLTSPDPWVALEDLTAQTGLPPVRNKGASVDELYASEQAALATERIIPLFHLPESYAAGPRLRNWRLRSDGGLELAGAWLEAPTP
ncbi:MAG TPA: ABC transporter substrate-binding protein [Candidatus Sulfotelmatobacter sp.]|nr:ABC transporter substrate-binding protein [Candidatus Sulfotelmatobacter sp.]